MRKKGGKKNSLNVYKGSMATKNGTESKKRKLTGCHGRYFGKKIHEVEGDDKTKTNSTTDNSDECDSDMEAVSDTEVDKHQDDGKDASSSGSSDEGSGTNDDGSNDESESDDGSSNDEEDIGNDNESDNGDEEIVEISEDDNSKTVTPSSKQKKLNVLNKQQNGSAVSKKAKKGRKSIENLPKFQGTIKESEQNQQTNTSTKKRKRPNEDKIEDEISPAKKSCFDDKTESSLEQRREERNSRSLFLKNLPPHTTVEMVKKLAPEVINVRIPLEGRKKVSSLYAFLEFENEEAAEKNYKRIMEKTIDDKKFTVDYCGEKSNYKKAPRDFLVNYKRLFIPSVPMDVTPDEIKQHFPDAKSFSSKQKGSKRLVFMSFEDEETAKKAFEENEKLTINGKKITVLLAFKKKHKVAMKPRRKAKIVPSIFEDENDLNASKSDLAESTEMTKEEKKKQKPKKKKKNPKLDKETTKMEIDADEEIETNTEKSKMKKKRKNKKVVK